MREVRAFTEEGVYILPMLANTPKARDFRAQLARLLRNIRERGVEQARELGYQQGRDEALALPTMKAERQAGYLTGMEEGIRIQRRQDGLVGTERALSYMRRGLSLNEAAKLCDCGCAVCARPCPLRPSLCRAVCWEPSILSPDANPCDLLTAAAARIRWQQRPCFAPCPPGRAWI